MRDVLHVEDAVRAYVAAWRNIARISGRAFNLGGSPLNAVSLLTLIRHVGSLLRREIPLQFAEWRPNDQRWFVADTRRVRSALSLPPPLPWRAGVGMLLRDLQARSDLARAVPA